jgi:2-polyprenyl-3-methyl-5-hydroxy-6-metoxy-1,4-benzoquinol methylase
MPSRYETPVPSHSDRFNRTSILLRWVGCNKDVLELGCSSGFISREMAKTGCRVVGVDHDRENLSNASLWCAHTVCGDLNDTSWRDSISQTFDVILLGDVLEHLINPGRLLVELQSLLRPEGYLVASIPNVAYWSVRKDLLLGRFDYTPTGLLDETHLRFFTCKTAHRLIEDAGYKIEQFHPVCGGNVLGSLRPAFQWVGNRLPNVLGYQLLFKAKSAWGLQRADEARRSRS